MGTAIKDLLIRKEVDISSLKNKTFGFDGYNIIYQFLTTIRDIDGNYLTNSKGKITSHLIGLYHRLTKIMQNDINVFFVFDGKPLELKGKTLEKRKNIKIEAEKKTQEAIDIGDFERASNLKRRTAKITQEMVEDTKILLEKLGIQYITAKSDGEAQASVMNSKGLIDGVVSQDLDCLLFGVKNLYRNLTFGERKKVPNKDYYVKVKPEKINLEETLEHLKIDRKKLIWIGILIGTDFNEKIPHIGPKTAYKLVKKYDSLEDILESLNYTPNFNINEIENIFLNPPYKEITKEQIMPKKIDYDGLSNYLIEELEFNKEKTEKSILQLKKNIYEKRKQQTLFGF